MMGSLFDDLQEGLSQAIDFEKGIGKARTVTYSFTPVRHYSNKDIREIRRLSGMTQSVFSEYMGVSKKTVEAWEKGRTHPTGSACRLLEILVTNGVTSVPFLKQ